MALPASPPISITQIQTEMGAPAGTPLTALVRGGSYTPNTAANAGVPTAPPIDVLDFLGASGARVQFANRGLTSSQVVPPSATATRTYVVNNSGITQTSNNGGAATTLETWLLAGAAADYEIRMTTVSGTIFSGPAFGVWHSAASGLTWGISRSGGAPSAGTTTGTALLECRRASDGVIVASATINLEATLDV